jgi:hypothetical protein
MEFLLEVDEQSNEQPAVVELSDECLSKVGGGLADDFVLS